MDLPRLTNDERPKISTSTVYEEYMLVEALRCKATHITKHILEKEQMMWLGDQSMTELCFQQALLTNQFDFLKYWVGLIKKQVRRHQHDSLNALKDFLQNSENTLFLELYLDLDLPLIFEPVFWKKGSIQNKHEQFQQEVYNRLAQEFEDWLNLFQENSSFAIIFPKFLTQIKKQWPSDFPSQEKVNDWWRFLMNLSERDDNVDYAVSLIRADLTPSFEVSSPHQEEFSSFLALALKNKNMNFVKWLSKEPLFLEQLCQELKTKSVKFSKHFLMDEVLDFWIEPGEELKDPLTILNPPYLLDKEGNNLLHIIAANYWQLDVETFNRF